MSILGRFVFATVVISVTVVVVVITTIISLVFAFVGYATKHVNTGLRQHCFDLS